MMKKILVFVFLGLFLTATLPLNVKAGNLIPGECRPQVVEGLKQYVCPQGLQLTVEQQNRINELNQRVLQKRVQNQNTINESIQTKTQNKEQIQERKATQAARLQETNKVRVLAYYGNLNTRYEAAITRLELLITRIEARLAIYKTDNPEVDVTDIEAQISEAKDLLLQVKADMLVASENLEAVLESSDPKDAFQVVKETVSESKKDLIEIHTILVQIIGDIKGLKVGQS